MIEVEYIAIGSCYAKILWIKQQFEDFGKKQSKIFIKCDNTSAINLTKNLIQYFRIKYIEIRYHFIRDHIQNNNIMFEFICTIN